MAKAAAQAAIAEHLDTFIQTLTDEGVDAARDSLSSLRRHTAGGLQPAPSPVSARYWIRMTRAIKPSAKPVQRTSAKKGPPTKVSGTQVDGTLVEIVDTATRGKKPGLKIEKHLKTRGGSATVSIHLPWSDIATESLAPYAATWSPSSANDHAAVALMALDSPTGPHQSPASHE